MLELNFSWLNFEKHIFFFVMLIRIAILIFIYLISVSIGNSNWEVKPIQFINQLPVGIVMYWLGAEEEIKVLDINPFAQDWMRTSKGLFL